MSDGIKLLRKIGVEFSGSWALDATDLRTTPKCKGRGAKRIEHRKRDKSGTWVIIPEMICGFKLLLVFDVFNRYVVAAKMAPIQENESPFLLELIEQGQRPRISEKARFFRSSLPDFSRKFAPYGKISMAVVIRVVETRMRYYNDIRRHASLDNVSPADYLAKLGVKARLAVSTRKP